MVCQGNSNKTSAQLGLNLFVVLALFMWPIYVCFHLSHDHAQFSLKNMRDFFPHNKISLCSAPNRTSAGIFFARSLLLIQPVGHHFSFSSSCSHCWLIITLVLVSPPVPM